MRTVGSGSGSSSSLVLLLLLLSTFSCSPPPQDDNMVVITEMELNREDHLRLNEAKVAVFQKGNYLKTELLDEIRKSIGYLK